MNQDWAEAYRKVVLAHHRQPRHRGPLPDASHQALGHNVLCGDRIDLRLKVVDGVIESARFEAEAGALSIASASMLTSHVHGLSVTAARDWASRAIAALESAVDAPLPADLGELAAFAGVRAYPSRRRAVTLPLAALLTALDGGGSVSTEGAS